MDKIKHAFEDYKAILGQIDARRSFWTQEIHKRIKDTLTEIKDSLKMDCTLQDLQLYKNYSAINLHFNFKPSGIEPLHRGEKFEGYTKEGGYLAFSQSYNGIIFVIIGFPKIKGIIFNEKEPIKRLDYVEPASLTVEKIHEYVILFLKTLSEYEAQENKDIERTPMGYKVE